MGRYQIGEPYLRVQPGPLDVLATMRAFRPPRGQGARGPPWHWGAAVSAIGPDTAGQALALLGLIANRGTENVPVRLVCPSVICSSTLSTRTNRPTRSRSCDRSHYKNPGCNSSRYEIVTTKLVFDGSACNLGLPPRGRSVISRLCSLLVIVVGSVGLWFAEGRLGNAPV